MSVCDHPDISDIIRNSSYYNLNSSSLPQPLPTWEVALKLIACVLVEVVAFIGNVLIIVIVARTPRMRSTTNCYLVNMAVADLLLAIVPAWIHISNDIITMGQNAWFLGSFLCKFSSFLQVTGMVASVMTLMVITGDRLYAITFPLHAHVTQRKVRITVAVIWLCALSVGLPPALFYTYVERQWLDYLEKFCTDVWPTTITSSGKCDNGMTSRRAYWTTVTVVLNWLPMTVMCVVYAVIIYKLQFTRIPTAPSPNSVSAQQRVTRRVVRMMLIVLIAFIICTIPFQITNLYPLYSHDIRNKLPDWHQPVSFAAVFLMYANSAINPILYGALNKNFRRGARSLVNGLLCCKGLKPVKNITMSTRPSQVSFSSQSLSSEERTAADDSLGSLNNLSAKYSIKARPFKMGESSVLGE